jgi:hypothetical protein
LYDLITENSENIISNIAHWLNSKIFEKKYNPEYLAKKIVKSSIEYKKLLQESGIQNKFNSNELTKIFKKIMWGTDEIIMLFTDENLEDYYYVNVTFKVYDEVYDSFSGKIDEIDFCEDIETSMKLEHFLGKARMVIAYHTTNFCYVFEEYGYKPC